ncbi:MAG: diaminopimelate decarboxylase, partial [Spirochaetes bacterium]|nr:diaminopimelate decarboxylase [Spirochaetota bacterium]
IFMFNCESTNEIKKIDSIAEKSKKIVPIAIRINPDIIPKTHKYIITGKKETKFGISIYEIDKVLHVIRQCKNIQLKGIHFHIGSQITEVTPYIKAINKIVSLIKTIRKDKFNIEYLNIGGGLGIIYKNEKPQTPCEFAEKVIPLVKKNNLKLILEPGRYIVGNAGILLTKVTYIKKSLNKTFVIVDAGMNTLIRPSLYEAYHNIVPVKESKKKFTIDVVGPICETGDFFAKDRSISRVEENDFLAIKSAGAYGRVMASTYNERPLPLEVMVDNKKFYKV